MLYVCPPVSRAEEIELLISSVRLWALSSESRIIPPHAVKDDGAGTLLRCAGFAELIQRISAEGIPVCPTVSLGRGSSFNCDNFGFSLCT
jgi:hypothetical protein